MTRKRSHGEGGIDQRAEKSWRVRYRIGGRRFAQTVHGSRSEAQKRLRQLLHSSDAGEHIVPHKMTVGQWVEHWISIGCPGNKRRRQVGERSIERYGELLRHHVVPALGERQLQQLDPAEIDKLYVKLAEKVSARTAHHVHTVLGACLGTAARTQKISKNPMLRLEKIPSPAEADHGRALEEGDLATLVRGFRGSSLFTIVAIAAFTGARRNEILALKWSDLDTENKTLRIERAIEQTKRYGLRIKGPKKEEHKRTISIDDDTLALLLTERERHLRIIAGIPDGAPVELSLINLPDGALMFPRLPMFGKSFSHTALRNPRNTTKEFVRKAAALGFPGLRLHDLRGTHETHLLDRGMSPAAVAQRCGHDPATMLRSYAKRTRKADARAAELIGELAKGALK